MSCDCQVYLLACAYGRDRGLTDKEIQQLANHMQSELEDEIKWIIGLREAVHANQAAATDKSRQRWAAFLRDL